MNNAELVQELNKIRDLMISVSTGGSRIQEVDEQYQIIYAKVSAELASRRVANPITYNSLWDWYGRWSSGDLPSYQSRRTFVSNLITQVVNLIQTGKDQEFIVTGWERVDRTVGEIRNRLAAAESEEQFQAVGLLCRDGLISLAQAVYDKSKHPPLNHVEPSPTDAKCMLEAYIAVEMKGEANEELRSFVKAALRLANALTHARTADFKRAAISVDAITTIVNVIAIISGRIYYKISSRETLDNEELKRRLEHLENGPIDASRLTGPIDAGTF